MQLIYNFFNRLFKSGVSRARTEEDMLKIEYLNQSIVIGTLMFLPNLLFELYLGFFPATVLNLIFVLSSVICFFINRRGYYNIARSFAIVGLDLILLAANFTEGTQTGNYLIYTSLILLFPILAKLNDSKKEILFLFLFTTTCFLVSIFICPTKGYLAQDLSEAAAASMFKASYMVLFGLTFILAYIIYLVTQKKEAELINAKNLAEESSKIKLQFISNMSHELRTPLNGIIGTTNLLQLDDHTSQQNEQYELLKYSSQHMLHLVNDVLDFSKIESGKIELSNRQFNLQIFIKNIYNSFAPQFEKKNLYFKLLHNDDDLNYVLKSDDIRLGQILNNLLANALKFTHEGGVTLGITTNLLTDQKLEVKFDITDTGIGIKKQHLDKIFESFIQADLNTTRKYGGTGLGLTISKKLATIFNTTLEVESEVGKGSRFSFSPIFTISNNTTDVSISSEKSSFESLKGMHILIAEDNAINMLIARKFLKKWGVTLTEAINGKDAINLCSTQHFDLVLLDLEMPVADGYMALQEIRKLHPTVPAVAFTASVFENIEEVLLSKGFNDYVLKPFAPQELNHKLHKQKVQLSKIR